jgi:hypothetical protein
MSQYSCIVNDCKATCKISLKLLELESRSVFWDVRSGEESTFADLHVAVSQETELLSVAALRTSGPTA